MYFTFDKVYFIVIFYHEFVFQDCVNIFLVTWRYSPCFLLNKSFRVSVLCYVHDTSQINFHVQCELGVKATLHECVCVCVCVCVREREAQLFKHYLLKGFTVPIHLFGVFLKDAMAVQVWISSMFCCSKYWGLSQCRGVLTTDDLSLSLEIR